jgi:hypothetical protein
VATFAEVVVVPGYTQLGEGSYVGTYNSAEAVSVPGLTSLQEAGSRLTEKVSVGYTPVKEAPNFVVLNGFVNKTISVTEAMPGQTGGLAELVPFPSGLISVTEAGLSSVFLAEAGGFPSFIIAVSEGSYSVGAEGAGFPDFLISLSEAWPARGAELVPWPSMFGGPANVIYVTEATYGAFAAVFLAETIAITEQITVNANLTGLFLVETVPLSEALVTSASYTISLSESWPTWSESLTVTAAVPLAETVSLSEALAVQANHNLNLSETVPLSEAKTIVAHHFVHLSETVGLSENLTTGIINVVGLNETVGLSEALSVVYEAIVPLSETVAVTEALVVVANHFVALVETVGLSEALYIAVPIHLDETWSTYTEACNFQYEAVVGLSETVGLSEALSTQAEYVVSLSETWPNFTEEITVTLPVALSETVGLSEALAVERGAVVNESETWSTYTESVAVKAHHFLALSETVPWSEALVVTNPVALSETVSLSESLSTDFSGTQGLHETVAWSEARGIVCHHFLALSETWPAWTEAISVALPLTETVPWSESLAVHESRFLHLSENVALTEHLTIVHNTSQPLAESWPTWTESVFAPYSINLSENWGAIGESVTEEGVEHLGLSESWGAIGESLTIGQFILVRLVETVPLSEALATKEAFHLALAETVEITEKISAQSVNLFETVPWYEAITIEGQLEKALCFKNDVDPAVAYPTPINPNVDGLGANAFYPQNSTSNDENVGIARDSANNGTIFDPKLAYTARFIDQLLQGPPVGSNFTVTVAGGASPTSFTWVFTATSKTILVVNYTYSGMNVATEVRQVYGPDGTTIVAQITITNSYSGSNLTGFTQTRDV